MSKENADFVHIMFEPNFMYCTPNFRLLSSPLMSPKSNLKPRNAASLYKKSNENRITYDAVSSKVLNFGAHQIEIQTKPSLKDDFQEPLLKYPRIFAIFFWN